MLRVNLMDLDREGQLQIQQTIAPDDPLWGDLDIPLEGGVEVDLTLTATATGQVIAQGTFTFVPRLQCRRCLTDILQTVSEDVMMVWAPRDEFHEGQGEDGSDEIRVLELDSNDLEISSAIREEVVLAAPVYAICKEDCRGLCPKCGVNRNEETCDCVLDEPDPRWDALRALKED